MVDRATALQQLPELYARALMLRDEGLEDREIADRLDIPVEAVAPALRVAELKVAHILDGGTEEAHELAN